MPMSAKFPLREPVPVGPLIELLEVEELLLEELPGLGAFKLTLPVKLPVVEPLVVGPWPIMLPPP